jgi:hypothetical protein
MELYYRSRINRNIVQSQVALANYNSSSFRKSLRQSKKRKSLHNEKKDLLGSAAYDEQLTNLLRQSIYKQKFGNKLDDLNKILSNKNIYRSSNANMEIDKESGSNKNEDEMKSENTLNEKNRDYILKQYNNPFLLSISHNITNGDLSMFHIKDKNKSNLAKINESAELNENNDENTINTQNKKDKNFYGVDFDIYSKKSSFSDKSKRNDVNIEMEDLSEKNNNNKNNYEMKDYNNEEKNKNDKYETIVDITLNYKNKKKLKEKKNDYEESPKFLKENNYDGDYDSDYEI